MIKFTSLSTRLTLWYSLSFSLSIALAFVALYLSFATILLDRMDEDLVEDIEEYQRIFEEEGLPGIQAEITRESWEVNESEQSFVRLLDTKGKQIYSTDLSHWQNLTTDLDKLSQSITEQQPILYNFKNDGQESESRGMYAPMNETYILHISESLEDNHELMELILMVVIALFLIALPLSSYIGWLMSQKSVSGIKAISRTAKEIQYGMMDRRVSGEMWGDELVQLANTFNAMLDRIHDLIHDMRELTDNVAHDLRSPLTRIRIMAESSLSHTSSEQEHEEYAANIIDECDRLMEMINTTLDLAAIESGTAKLHQSKVNLTELVNDACELFHPLTEEKNIHLTFNQQSDYFVRGDKQNLQRMISNLLDNAIKYTRQEGFVNLDITTNRNSINLIIADTGIGIPKAEQKKIFDRFYRCDQTRLERGCGLGLSFARAVARSHGGDISLNSEFEKGSSFRVSLSCFVPMIVR